MEEIMQLLVMIIHLLVVLMVAGWISDKLVEPKLNRWNQKNRSNN